MIRFGVIFVFSFLTGCGKPASIIPEQDFVQIMTDIHLAEALVNTHHPVKLRDSFYSVYMDQIYKNHNISKTDFESAMDHMLSDPEYLELIYKEVVSEITSRQDSLDMLEKGIEEKTPEVK